MQQGAPPEAPGTEAATEERTGLLRRLSGLPWPRLAAMLFVIVAAVTVLEYNYASSPVPPGVDPGDWITRSGAYVGLAVPPYASFGSPFIYPPLLFPFVGGLLRFLGGPIPTAFATGAILLFVFGLSLIYVAFRFVRFGPLQLGFVGSCVFSGSLLYMLFWGAYPNFFAFVFLNLLFVYLLLYARTGTAISGTMIGVALSLLYLTHSLTFAVGIVTVLVTAVLLLLVAGPRFLWVRIKNRGLIVGVGILVGTVVAYSLALKAAGVVPPNYLGANPSALTLDNIGQFFVPLATGPMFFPVGPPVYMAAIDAIVLLSSVAGALVLAHSLVHRYRPGWLTVRHTVALAAVVAALVTPVGGAIAGVGTDYSRFLYFLPVPIALLVAVTFDTVILGGTASRASAEGGSPAASRTRLPRLSRHALTAGYVATAVVLVLLFANVTAPTAAYAEKVDTGTTHSAQFLSAAQWLENSPVAGSVLTLQGVARWTEALTDRGVYDIGPTWLDFETWEIANSDLAFWALNSQYAVTDDSAILSYTPGSLALLSQTPMYSVFDDGVIFPVARVLPGALNATISTPNGTVSIEGASWGVPTLAVNATTGVGTYSYSNPWFNATISGTLAGVGGAQMEIRVAPSPGDKLDQLTVPLASPPADIALLHAPSSQSIDVHGPTFSWLSTGSLGPLPAPVTLNTSGAFTPAPSTSTVSTFPANLTLTNTFEVPSGSSSFAVALNLTTPGTGNPGVTLPLVLSTQGFLTSHNIHFLLVSSGTPYAPTIQFFQTVFGYTTVYLNSGWEVLEG
jgi:hypothetical protein